MQTPPQPDHVTPGIIGGCVAFIITMGKVTVAWIQRRFSPEQGTERRRASDTKLDGISLILSDIKAEMVTRADLRDLKEELRADIGSVRDKMDTHLEAHAEGKFDRRVA